MSRFLVIIFMFGFVASALNNCGGRTASFSPGDRFKARTDLGSGSSDVSSDSSSSNSTSSDGTVELDRAPDGHFYADVEINGSSVRALVDTGATGIALSREDARSAGIATSIGMPEVVGEGADGAVRGEVVELDRVTLGHKTVEDMRAVVLSRGEQTLLGQTFLSRFDSVEIRGDKMVLK
jgi:aspartyl protease family protein